jgi:cbb3-type cytochrome oxidase maturation protein
MSVLFVLVPVVLVVVLAAVLTFAWAARRGQFDDLTTPAWRALHDDEPPARAPGGESPGAVADAPTPARDPAREDPR